MSVEIIRDVTGIRARVAELKKNNKTVCLVPTMGGLHAGHLSLIAKAREVADHVVVSIFVNPKQFNNPDDLKTYPSNEEDDVKSIAKEGADLVFIPSVEEMYPQEFATEVKVTAGIDILCDAHRPGHFGGVATVVTKLFLQVGADYACFGEKDYQQLFIIERLVDDLNIPIKIIPAPTVREKDGLAMSSRNARLKKADRKLAPKLHKTMQKIKDDIHNGVDIETACAANQQKLESNGDFKVEYLEVRCGKKMVLMKELGSECRLFAAAWLGGVRLIDNIKL
jgi:pantoate--beta-alanine ligase